MTTNERARGPVLLFPGQGGYDGAALRLAHHVHPQVGEVFERIDTVTLELFGRRLSDVVLKDGTAELTGLLQDEPWVSQLAIFGAGLAAHRVLAAHGVRPAALAGHSLGEVTAMVAAGACTVEDGARIVVRRTELIAGSAAADGAMIAVGTGPERAGHLVGLIGHRHLAVAGENHEGQTILSGPRQAVDRARAAAAAVRLGCADLEVPFAFHNPSLAGVASEFAAYVRRIPRQPMVVPVYSPILGRFYENDTDLAGPLAEHLTRPVRFSAAVRELYERGERVFVEVGGRATLSSLVPKALRGIAGEDLSVLSTLSVGRNDRLRLPETLAALRALGLATAGDPDPLRDYFAPGLTPDEFGAFWAANRSEIDELVGRRLAAFQAPRNGTGGKNAPAALRQVTVPAEDEALPGQLSLRTTVPVPDPVRPDTESLFAEVRALYATALEYPEEVFTPDALLEAELGVDSVKQMELLSRASEQYGIPPRASGFRLSDHDTLGKIVTLLREELGRERAGAAA
ncbi:acyltransferase domain-containing protein [Actinomadura graeca]|uniref:[acyl-carrier-protein] S-malonyltransferase n=1 Tax=Actinomadura graeca TaxID=2750812 RepID=A0ABX8QYX6_9ACTN|nr:acyltransferase domain-containing protein [Actinomadura graeca]QXJ23389.1 acyltransferase domain-containing protein [Actinomadura graeca]